jgi:hypothetical protein
LEDNSVATSVYERELGDGHHIQVTWTGCQTARPTGALDNSTPKRTRYFFEVLIDDLYYYANRFVTSADAEECVDGSGNPLIARTDLILELCAERVAVAIEAGLIDSLPNDLGGLDLEELERRAGSAY